MIVIGPRLTATPEYKLAADWSREQLSRCGLRDARLESWEFGRGWALDKFTLEMIAPRYMPLMGYHFNVDPGTGPIYGWFLQGQETVRPMMDAWLEPFKDLGARRNVSESIGNTDHLSFTAAALPNFNPVQDYGYDVRTPHINVDSFERVRETDLKQGAVILASLRTRRRCRRKKCPDRRPPHRGFRNRPVTGIRASSLSGRPVVELLS